MVLISYLGADLLNLNQLSPLVLAADARDLQQPLQDDARKASTHTNVPNSLSRKFALMMISLSNRWKDQQGITFRRNLFYRGGCKQRAHCAACCLAHTQECKRKH